MSTWQEIPQSNFLKEQLQFPRVRTAFKNKEIALKEILTKHQIQSFEIDLYLRAFKQEQTLEVWAKPRSEAIYQRIKTYDFCRTSGMPGPKRIEGDGQIPEGFYRISHFNPKSNFLLSLKINYPNTSDRLLSDPDRPGDDIYIHGGCQTIGCIPITNDKIEEVYLLSVLAKEDGGEIPVHIFPFKMTEREFEKNRLGFPQYETFWSSLKKGYDAFEKEKKVPHIEISEDGIYEIK